jgi:hypothetical protein
MAQLTLVSTVPAQVLPNGAARWSHVVSLFPGEKLNEFAPFILVRLRESDKFQEHERLGRLGRLRL